VPLDNTAQDHGEKVNFRNQRFRKWMRNLPDLEGLAIFAKVAEARSLTRAAEELGVSKATISKSLARLETRLGTTLLHRTSRLLSLTEAGRGLLDPALQMLAHAEAAESEALNQAASPRGVVRLAAPMSFGLSYVGPALPDFLSMYPEISVDLHLSDEVVDLVAGGFDVALRIAALQDSSLVARRLCHVERFLVGAPAYFARRGRPSHPRELPDHDCLTYAHLATADQWRFRNEAGDEVAVRPSDRLRGNNGDALTPALLAGHGVTIQPDFIVWKELAEGRLEKVMTDWRPLPIALHLVTPPGRRGARVQALVDFLIERFSSPE